MKDLDGVAASCFKGRRLVERAAGGASGGPGGETSDAWSDAFIRYLLNTLDVRRHTEQHLTVRQLGGASPNMQNTGFLLDV